MVPKHILVPVVILLLVILLGYFSKKRDVEMFTNTVTYNRGSFDSVSAHGDFVSKDATSDFSSVQFGTSALLQDLQASDVNVANSIKSEKAVVKDYKVGKAETRELQINTKLCLRSENDDPDVCVSAADISAMRASQNSIRDMLPLNGNKVEVATTMGDKYTISIPRGEKGPQGDQGDVGPRGVQGEQGERGPKPGPGYYGQGMNEASKMSQILLSANRSDIQLSDGTVINIPISQELDYIKTFSYDAKDNAITYQHNKNNNPQTIRIPRLESMASDGTEIIFNMSTGIQTKIPLPTVQSAKSDASGRISFASSGGNIVSTTSYDMLSNINLVNNKYVFTTTYGKSIPTEITPQKPIIMPSISNISYSNDRYVFAMSDGQRVVSQNPSPDCIIDAMITNGSNLTFKKLSNRIITKNIIIANPDNIPVISDLIGWYVGERFNTTTNTWIDRSGRNNHVLTNNIRGSINITNFNGNSAILGGTTSGLTFPSTILPSSYTLFHVARYVDNGRRGRIFDGDDKNWFSGFHGGKAGAAYHGSSLLTAASQGDIHGYNWVISTDQVDMYRSNLRNRTVDNSSQHQNAILTINNGVMARGAPSTEASDWMVAAVIVYARKLTMSEILLVETYLNKVYMLNHSHVVVDFIPTSDPKTHGQPFDTVNPTPLVPITSGNKLGSIVTDMYYNIIPGIANVYNGMYWQVYPGTSFRMTFDFFISLNGVETSNSQERLCFSWYEDERPGTYQEEWRCNGGYKLVMDMRTNKIKWFHRSAAVDETGTTIAPLFRDMWRPMEIVFDVNKVSVNFGANLIYTFTDPVVRTEQLIKSNTFIGFGAMTDKNAFTFRIRNFRVFSG
jgi:hypothetical protein